MSVLVTLAGFVLALVLASALGGLVLLRARLGPGPLAHLVRALLGLALLASFHAHAAVGLTLATLIAAATWRGHGLEDALVADERKSNVVALGAIAVALVAIVSRPPVPLFASESAHVALARALSLREVLPTADRSLLLPLMTSALSLGSDATDALAMSGSLVGGLCFALFALLLARSSRTGWDEALPLVVLASAPFAWVLLRSVSVELPVGLAAGSMVLGAERAGKGDRLGAPAAITAALLLAMADEGIVLAVAVALSLALVPGARDAHRAALLAVICLGLASVAERWGAPRLELFDPAPSTARELVSEALRHVADIATWGLVPAVGLAALVASFRRAAPEEPRRLAVTLLLTLAMFLAALVLAPIELRERALDGGLLDRLALELLPLLALLIAEGVRATLPSPPAE